MNRINVQDIDFSLLKTMSRQGSRSIIYEDDDLCYKMFYGLSPYELEILERKLIDMDGIQINGACLPTDLIVNGDKLEGVILGKFKDSISIYDKFSGQFIDFKELFNYVVKASQILRKIHDNNIICQDLSFDNILVDINGNVAFCDFDGCSYNGIESPFIAMPMKKLIEGYRKTYAPIKDMIKDFNVGISLLFTL